MAVSKWQYLVPIIQDAHCLEGATCRCSNFPKAFEILCDDCRRSLHLNTDTIAALVLQLKLDCMPNKRMPGIKSNSAGDELRKSLYQPPGPLRNEAGRCDLESYDINMLTRLTCSSREEGSGRLERHCETDVYDALIELSVDSVQLDALEFIEAILGPDKSFF